MVETMDPLQPDPSEKRHKRGSSNKLTIAQTATVIFFAVILPCCYGVGCTMLRDVLPASMKKTIEIGTQQIPVWGCLMFVYAIVVGALIGGVHAYTQAQEAKGMKRSSPD